VRELILRYWQNTTPAELTSAHIHLTEFFVNEQERLGLSEADAYDSEMWCSLECERVYQAIINQSDRNISIAVNAFLHAFHLRWGFAESIVKVCQEIVQETGNQTARKYTEALTEVFTAYDKLNPDTGLQGLGVLETRQDLTSRSRCELYTLRGEMYRAKDAHDQALADFDRAIELEEKYSWAIAERGQTYQQIGKYEQALADFDRAIELARNLTGQLPVAVKPTDE
jgi:tetratricopeptide (TPR) repeat protein